MRVAILGAGFAGLAVSWYLLHYRMGVVSIDLYDPEPIGEGVSGLSSGLLHTYPGKEARKSWRADFCMKETHRLITEASRGANRSVILSRGILRPAVTEQQFNAFRACALQHDDTEWWDSQHCMKEIPGLSLPESHGGLYITNGFTINVKAYLEGLWQTIAKMGVQYHKTMAVKEADLKKYDAILVAIGALTRNFPGLQSLPITPIKGQILKLEWPEGVPPPQISLISNKYLVMSADQKNCVVGATFERAFDSLDANQAKAVGDILPHVTSYFPALEKAKILDCRAGFRASTPNHLPIVGKLSDKIYFLTGLGSKGLLYHAWVAKRMARAIITKDPNHFPKDIYHTI